MKGNNTIIIILIVAIIGIGAYFYTTGKDSSDNTTDNGNNPNGGNNGASSSNSTAPSNKPKCYNRHSTDQPYTDYFDYKVVESVQNIISAEPIIPGYHSIDKKQYIAGFLKGINVEVTSRNITLYQEDIKEWIASPYAMRKGVIEVGDLLCDKSSLKFENPIQFVNNANILLRGKLQN